MSADPRPKRAAGEKGRLLRAGLQLVVFVFLLPFVLFLVAGTFAWSMAWGYIGSYAAATLAGRLVVLFRNPSLLLERARSLEAEDVQPGDRLLVLVVAVIGPLATWIVCGLDFRLGWCPDIPIGVQAAAFLLLLFGFAIGNWAFVINAFFSALVRIQADREHAVVDQGPYSLVRHPAYSGGILAILATPLFLGSAWGLIPAALTVAALILRTAREDQMLQRDLSGYAQYARVTRYRLVPGLW